MKRHIFNPDACQTVAAVRDAMDNAQVCEVCRTGLATHVAPPTCDECYEHLCGPEPMELAATA